GYSAYDDVRLFHSGQVLATPRVYKGTEGQVKVGVKLDQFVTVPKGAARKLKTACALNEPLIAPLAAGQRVGVAKVMSDDGKEIASVPVVALNDVPQAGLLGRLWDSAL